MGRFYSPEDLEALDKKSLETIAEARGVEVAGAGGKIVKDDLVAAISDAQDRTGINPALEAEPEPEDQERTYKVIGSREVHGNAPGSTFTRFIPADQEALLLESGALAVSNPNPKEGE